MKPSKISLLFAVVAFCLAASRINHGLIDSSLPAGPGLTLDESFNIGQGIYLFESFLDYGPLLFSPTGAEEVFGAQGYLPDHPPLARFMLGAAHQLTSWAIPGAELSLFNVPAARLGSCFFLAMTVLLLMEFVRRRYGLATAIWSAVALLLMPRVIGHARIAAQETTTTFFWLLAVVPLLSWWTADKAPTSKQSLIAGLLFGLLLAAKIQGVFLPPLIVAWSLWRFRFHGIRPLAIWGLTGFAVFWILWPWLWLDPIAHFRQYVIKTSERPTLYVWYLGERFADKAVPFHYPFVMLLATTPFAVTVAFAWRMVARRFDRIETLALGTIVFPLLVFALPGTPIYDSVRLFLVVMPMLAFFAARGVMNIWQRMPASVTGANDALLPISKRNTAAVCLYVAMLVSLLTDFRSHGAFCLEDYSFSVGGTKLAVEELGLECSYWAEGMNGDFWNQVPEGSTIHVAPVSHQFQLQDLQQLVPIVKKRNIKLRSFLYDPTQQRGLLLLLHRLADLPPGLRDVPPGASVVAEAKHRGVVMARLVDTSQADWSHFASWPKERSPKTD